VLPASGVASFVPRSQVVLGRPASEWDAERGGTADEVLPEDTPPISSLRRLSFALRPQLPASTGGVLLAVAVSAYVSLVVLHLLGSPGLLTRWVPAAAAVVCAGLLLVGTRADFVPGRGAWAALFVVAAVGVLVGGEHGAVVRWASALLPAAFALAVGAYMLASRRTTFLDGPVLQLTGPPGQKRAELFDSIFHGFVNTLVELVALVAAFIFYLSGQASSAMTRPLLSAAYDSQRVLLAGMAHRAMDSACEQLPDGAGGLSCCALGLPQRSADAVARLSAMLRETGSEQNAATTQKTNNLWVYRTALLFLGMAFVAFFVTYATNRLAGGPSVNLGYIVRYNVLLLAAALVVQVGFMLS
jgi:hypothetical protein